MCLSHATYPIQCCIAGGDDRLQPQSCGRGMDRQRGQCEVIRSGSFSVSDQPLNLIIPLRESVHMAHPKNFLLSEHAASTLIDGNSVVCWGGERLNMYD